VIEFVFHFGDDWRHRCEVLAEKLDVREEFGETPREHPPGRVLPSQQLAVQGCEDSPPAVIALSPEVLREPLKPQT
jgi:hypothetical protein